MLPSVTTPTTETVEPAAQAAANTEAPQEEAFDKDRAMLTIHKLREGEKEAKKLAKELEALKAEKAKRDEAEMTEAQKLQKQADELAAQNAQLMLDIIRRDVIAETGLPAALASRLQGNTKEEMLADAEELKKLIPQVKVAPTLQPTNPSNGNNNMSDDARREFLGLRR
jgi:hypothetical protein